MAINFKSLLHNERYNTNVSLLLLILIGFFIRGYGISEWAFSNDEIWHVYVATRHSFFDVFYANIVLDGHPILPYWIWHVVGILFGVSEAAFRLPSVVLGTVSILVAFFFGKEVFKEDTAGRFFAFYFSFSPILVQQSQVVRGYSMALFFVMISAIYAVKFYKEAKMKYILFYFIALFTAFLCEFAIIYVALFTSLIMLKKIFEEPYNKMLHFALWASIHVFLLAYLGWFSWLVSNIGKLDFTKNLSFYINYTSSIYDLFSRITLYFLAYILDTNIFEYLNVFSFLKKFGSIAIIEFATILVIFLYGILISFRKYKLLLLLFFIYTVLLIGFQFFSIIPMDFARRNIGYVLALCSMSYIGFKDLIFSKSKLPDWFFLPFVLSFSSLVILSYLINPGLDKREYHEYRSKISDISEVKDFIKNNVKDDDIIVTDWLSCITLSLEDEYEAHNNYRIYKYLGKSFYVIDSGDYRTNIEYNLNSLQKLLKRSNINFKNLWLVKIQMPTIIMKEYQHHDFYDILGKSQVESDIINFKEIDRETSSVSKEFFKSKYKKFDKCTLGAESSNLESCNFYIYAVSLPKKSAEKIFLQGKKYIDPRDIIEEVVKK